jgi:hypothetical protein
MQPSFPSAAATRRRLGGLLLRGLGSDESITELLSSLLFALDFTSRLIEIGCADAMAAKAEIRSFLDEAPAARRRRAAVHAHPRTATPSRT